MADTTLQSVFIATLDTTGKLRTWQSLNEENGQLLLSTNAETGIVISEDGIAAVPFSVLNRNSIGIAFCTESSMEIHEYDQDSVLVVIPRDICLMDHNYYICGDIQFNDFNIDAFVLKIDSKGNILWMKTFGRSWHSEIIHEIRVTEQKDFVIAGARYASPSEPYFVHGWVLCLDSLGNKKWEWEASESEIPHKALRSIQFDSTRKEWVCASLLVKSVYINGLDVNIDMWEPILVRRDSTLGLISFRDYGPYAYNGYVPTLIQSVDGGWIAAGNMSCLTEEDPTYGCDRNYGRIIKTNKDLDLEWSVRDTAFYDPEVGPNNYLSGLCQSQTGSIYTVGWATGYNEDHVYRSYGWLLKISADGCVDTLCTTTSLFDEISSHLPQVNVYPNPAIDQITVNVPEDIRDATVSLYGLQGRFIMSQHLQPGENIVNIGRQVEPGIYIWRVTTSAGKMVDRGKVVIAM